GTGRASGLRSSHAACQSSRSMALVQASTTASALGIAAPCFAPQPEASEAQSAMHAKRARRGRIEVIVRLPRLDVIEEQRLVVFDAREQLLNMAPEAGTQLVGQP